MKLTGRLTVAMAGLVVFTAAVLGFIIQNRLSKLLLESELARMEARVATVSTDVLDYVEMVRSDLLATIDTTPVQSVLEALSAEGSEPTEGSTLRTWAERASVMFGSVLRAKPNYLAYQFIDSLSGQELIRADWAGPQNVRTVIAPTDDFAPSREWLDEVLAAPPRTVRVSPVEPSAFAGPGGEPASAAVRLAVRVEAPGSGRSAVLQIHLDMAPLFGRLHTGAAAAEKLYLVDSQGRILVHPDFRGPRRAGQRVALLVEEFPSLAGAWSAARRVETLKNAAGESSAVATKSVSWDADTKVAVLEVVPTAAILRPFSAIVGWLWAAGGLAVGVALLLAVILARSLTKPIVDTTAAVEAFTRGQPLLAPLHAPGEVGVLAHAFDGMAREMGAKTAALEREIQERRRTGEELAREIERARLFAALVESSNEAILALSPAGVITACNPAAVQLFERSADELIGQDVQQVFGSGEGRSRDAMFDRVFKEGATAQFEMTHHGQVGADIDLAVSAAPVRGPAGETIGFALIARDISERKHAEDRFRLVVESSPSGLMLVDQAGLITLVNQEAERMFGYRREELLGASIEMVVPHRSREAHVRYRAEFHAAPSTRRMGAGRDLFGLRKDGTEFPVEVGLNPLHTPRGVYVLATIVDITARKRHEEETRKLESRLRQSEKLEAIGQLAGGVAHDFNNILTAILGYVEATQAQLEVSAVDPTEFHNALEQIKKSALSAAELTRQLLAFGRRQLARPRPLNLNEAVRSVEPMLRRLLPENVAVELHLAPDVRNTLADPSQVEQVIVNLVVNARDAMPTGGSLTIRTENAQLDDRYALLHPEVLPGEYVALVVSDVGCGMASATMARIFDPFFTTKAAGQGTGMGLSTVYGIVKQAKGHVSVYSEVGKGTTFKIFLPAEAASVAAAASMRTPDASTPQGTETILVAEDNELVRWVIQNILRGAGYNLLLAANGTEALRLADEHQGRIDMLVTDVVMPDIHGKDLAERLLARGLAPKVLFLSGYTSDVIAHHGVLEPGLALLEKPFTRQALLQRVRQLLDAPTAGPVSTAALSSVEPTADRSEV